MSRKKTPEAYQKTFSFRFFRWIRGEKDPYLGKLEMRPQEEYHVSEEAILRREKEHDAILDKVYDTEHNKGLWLFHSLYEITSVLFCLFLIALLLITVSYLPATGADERPSNNEVAARYIEDGVEETGAVNIVAGMILTYRAFDTFGETNVLFIATCCVMILLMIEDEALKKQETHNDRRFEPKNDPILQGSARVLCPIIFICGFYIMLNGHLGPGGGFSGGAVTGAGMVLYVSAFGFKKTQRFFDEHIYKIAKISALLTYGLIGTYFYITGANGIENHIPLGIPGHILSGGIILPINVSVGIEVACTIYAFYALFRRGGL